MRPRLAAAARPLLTLALVGGAFAAFWVAVPVVVGPNFHEVLPGQVYRSGQLSADVLDAAIERYGLRAVVNLRGVRPGASWYDEEIEVARRRRVIHHDIDLSARRLPPRPAVSRLIELLRTLPRPVLLHCGAGADRAGLASTLARMVVGGARLADARSELGFAYGHLPFGPSREMGRFFDLYDAYLRQTGETDTPATLERWVQTRYVPYVYSARLEALAFSERAAPGERLDVRIRVTNTSPGPWRLSTSRLEGIKLGLRVRRADGTIWREYDRAGYLMRVVAPGETLELAPPVLAPREPGRYVFKLDMVDEHVTWFEDQGSAPVVLPLIVE